MTSSVRYSTAVRFIWNWRMEHYHKKQSFYIDEACRENEVKISSAGKPQDIATKVSHLMKEFPSRGVMVMASGGHVTKAVTVAEILKRRLSNLHQHTEIKYIRVEDVWEPDQPGLDQLKVTRNIPAISITLLPPDVPATNREGGRTARGGGKSATLAITS